MGRGFPVRGWQHECLDLNAILRHRIAKENMADSDSDDVPTLPADTLAILKQFQQEKVARQQKLESSVQDLDSEADDIQIEEDWQLSQFWYDDQTATTLAKEALRCVGEEGKIALISCPTLYRPIAKLKGPKTLVNLLEYDKRFSIFGQNFIFYDYNAPLELPLDLKGSFDLVIADPPFLSEECLHKVASTIQFLAKDKIILCTGAIMQQLADDLLHLKKCKFIPHHRNNLGNEFGCYANYEMDRFLEAPNI